jgi:hypothetical protein
MSDNQSGKTEKKRSTPSYIAMIGAIATSLAIINMSVGSEAQSQPVLILEYAALALGLFALVGGLIMMTMQK